MENKEIFDQQFEEWDQESKDDGFYDYMEQRDNVRLTKQSKSEEMEKAAIEDEDASVAEEISQATETTIIQSVGQQPKRFKGMEHKTSGTPASKTGGS